MRHEGFRVRTIREIDEFLVRHTAVFEVLHHAARDHDDALRALVEVTSDGTEYKIGWAFRAAGGEETLRPEVAHLKEKGNPKAPRHAVSSKGGEEVRGGADDDIRRRFRLVPACKRALEGQPVARAAPIVRFVGCGPEPEEIHTINLLGDGLARSGRRAAGVAAGVKVEVGRGDGDVPIAAHELAGQFEVAGAAAIGGGNGEVVDPEEGGLLGQHYKPLRNPSNASGFGVIPGPLPKEIGCN